MTRRSEAGRVLALAAALLLLAPRLLGAQAQPDFSHGIVLATPAALPPVTLVGPHGGAVPLRDLVGRWLWVYFGFTHCPDACPTALAGASREYRALGEPAERLAVVFVSLDPQRDTPRRLATYVPLFHHQLVGLTGTSAAIAEVVRAFGVEYRRHESAPMGPAIDHTGYVHAVDPAGIIRAIYPPQEVGHLAKDFAFLKTP
jgi:protein SCO1/2